jgi:4-amino-4-deoxy-L-arabinose transferase-like glycosyltransferase
LTAGRPAVAGEVTGATWLRIGLVAALTLAALASRTSLPVDETRYLAVAWEMWQRGDFLVPFRNGEAYSHKPPLLFWLIHAGWAIFGVNELTPRLVSPLCALGTVWMTSRIAKTLWPDAPWRGESAAWIALGAMLFVVFAQMLMFDTLLAFCVSIGVLGLATAAQGRARGFALLALSIGLGVLAKGPVVLLHLLPAALLAPAWLRRAPMRWSRWYLGVVLAILGGAAIALAWAIPAGLRGGQAYRDAIFWGQTAHRMVDSFAHRRPFWWYLPMLPILLAPWLVWMPLWRGLRNASIYADPGVRLAALMALFTLAAFSFISGKQVHYLVPQVSSFALLAAFALDRQQPAGRPWAAMAGLVAIAAAVLALPHVKLPPNLAALHALSPLWTLPFLALTAWLGWSPRTPQRQVPVMAAIATLTFAAALLVFIRAMSDAYDVGPMARRIAELQAAGRPVANDGVYHAQYQFAGRLDRPVTELETHEEAEQWIAAHPHGVVIMYFRPPADPSAFGPLLVRPYRGRIAAMFDAPAALPVLQQSVPEEDPDAEEGARRKPPRAVPR